MDKKRLQRKEIPEKYKWDLNKFYQNKFNWDKNFDKINSLVIDIINYKGKIMDNSNNLYQILIKVNNLNRLLINLYVYANMKYHEDMSNNDSIIMKGRIEKIYTEVSEQLYFIETEILKSNDKVIEEYIKEKKELEIYIFFFRRLFRKKSHILSDDEEKLIASMGEILSVSNDVYNVMRNTDLQYGNVVINNERIKIYESNFVKLLNNKDQNTRKRVFKKYYKTFKSFKNTFATTLKYNIKEMFFISKVRKYKSPLQMSLYDNNIDEEVYYNLIDTVNNNLDLLHRYIKIRKKELGVDKLHMYDIYAKMVPDDNKEYSYDESFLIIKKALQPLGNEYIKLLDKAYQQQWIDVYDNEYKMSGAYSWGSYDSYPYILLNYNKTLDNVFTLAHELGHSMHSYYTNHNQPYIYASHAIFTAEVASLVNEILLCYYLLNNSNDVKQKKIILNELLEKFKGTLYRQTMFAEFEKNVFDKENNNEVLTEKVISDVYYKLNKKYYGKDIIHDKEIYLEWCRIPHFYRPFYVYQYATGISAACSIATDILDGKKEVLNKYIEFLKSGDNDYPINLLKKVGIDMSTKEPLEKALKMFKDTLDQYEFLMNK